MSDVLSPVSRLQKCNGLRFAAVTLPAADAAFVGMFAIEVRNVLVQT